MKQIGLCLLFVLFRGLCVAAQPPTDTLPVTRQCSAIRELVYSAWHNRFSPFLEGEIRNSNGYMKGGGWVFSTIKYHSTMQWPGASTSYLEHYEETVDTLVTDRWRYIAEYSNVPNVILAEQLYRQLNSEIEGCPYPLSDTADVVFQPLSPEMLPKERPSFLETASMYELPLPGSRNKNSDSPVMLMVGIEKLKNNYRVSLVVDNTSYRKK